MIINYVYSIQHVSSCENLSHFRDKNYSSNTGQMAIYNEIMSKIVSRMYTQTEQFDEGPTLIDH